MFTANYYAYEYGVLIGLTNIFKDIQLNISSDIFTAYATKKNENTRMLEQVPVMNYNGDRVLTFKLPKEVNISIKDEVITEMFIKEAPIEEAITIVSDIIKDEWLKIILK